MTPVKTEYPLTSIVWPFRRLKFTAHRGLMFFFSWPLTNCWLSDWIAGLCQVDLLKTGQPRSQGLFGKQNTRGNVSKISVSHMSYRYIGSKSTNHSPLAWRREGQKVTLLAVIGGFRSDLSITHTTDGNFGKVSQLFCFLKSRINENGGKMILLVISEKCYQPFLESSHIWDNQVPTSLAKMCSVHF